MKLEMKFIKRRTAFVPQPYKTKEDFLRWWRGKELLKEQEGQEQSDAIAQALMVWADDGGATA